MTQRVKIEIKKNDYFPTALAKLERRRNRRSNYSLLNRRDTRDHSGDYFYLHISIRRHSDRYHYHRTAWLILTFKYHFASRKLHLRPGSTSNSSRKMSPENVPLKWVSSLRMKLQGNGRNARDKSERLNESSVVSTVS